MVYRIGLIQDVDCRGMSPVVDYLGYIYQNTFQGHVFNRQTCVCKKAHVDHDPLNSNPLFTP